MGKLGASHPPPLTSASMESETKLSPRASKGVMVEDPKRCAVSVSMDPPNRRFASESITALAQSDSDSTTSDGERTTNLLLTSNFKPTPNNMQQSQSQLEDLQQFLGQIPLLNSLSDLERNALGAALTMVDYVDGEVIASQGDRAEMFYFIADGVVDELHHSQNGSKAVETKLATHEPRGYFGEAALIHPQRRIANFIAVGQTRCFMLRSEMFERLLGSVRHVMEFNLRVRILKNIDRFATLPQEKVDEIALECVIESFEDGDQILCQGDAGDKFYMIQQGEVVFTRHEELEGDAATNDTEEDRQKRTKEIGRLFVGQYFGEGALLTNASRRASAYAVEHVVVLTLERSTFCRVMDGTLRSSLIKDFTKRRDLGKEGMEALIEFGDLEHMRVLGAGAFGQVLLVRHKVTGGTFALKCMQVAQILKRQQEEHVNNEKAILRAIKHRFVVNMLQTFVGPNHVYALFEAVLGGELFVLMRKVGRFKLAPALFYVAQVVLAVEYLHSLSIIHRDIKPENLLLTDTGYVKVTDFGLAKRLFGTLRTYTICGTPSYSAPEVYNNRGHGRPVDWWAVGVFTHELLAGMTPFAGDADRIYASLRSYSNAYPNIKLPKGLSGDAGDFVIRLLNPKPRYRLGSRVSCRSHQLFAGYPWKTLVEGELTSPYKPKIASLYDTHNFYNPVMHNGQKKLDIDEVDPRSIEAGKEWVFTSYTNKLTETATDTGTAVEAETEPEPEKPSSRAADP